MDIDAELVHRNCETLVAHEAALTEAVYETFFGAHPELLELFTAPRSPAAAQMVRETLMYAIDHLDGACWVEANLASLGAKHVDYEVGEEMYAWFVDAMLTGMASVSGAEWTTGLARSWRELLQTLADLMIAELPGERGAELA